jgi:hypothetical protein
MTWCDYRPMTGPVPEEDPRPRDVVADEATPEEAEELQEQQPEPESWEQPDAG